MTKTPLIFQLREVFASGLLLSSQINTHLIVIANDCKYLEFYGDATKHMLSLRTKFNQDIFVHPTKSFAVTVSTVIPVEQSTLTLVKRTSNPVRVLSNTSVHTVWYI